jgi:membrane protein DedA with SNARE-associated domain
VAIAVTSSVLLLIALAGAGGSALIACLLACAAALGAIGVRSRSATAVVIACAFAAAAVLGMAGLSLGRRASTATAAGSPFPLVVGLPLQRAEALFQRHGPVTFVVRRVAYGERGTVLHATGYSPDGTYAPGSTITLVVGTRAPSQAAP